MILQSEHGAVSDHLLAHCMLHAALNSKLCPAHKLTGWRWLFTEKGWSFAKAEAKVAIATFHQKSEIPAQMIHYLNGQKKKNQNNH